MKKSDLNKVHLDNKTADEVLQNVFVSCSKKPNTIPFETLKDIEQRHRRRSLLFRRLRAAALILLLLLLLVPLFFIRPEITKTSLTSSAADGTMCYHFIVKGYLPVFEVTAKLNNREIPVSNNVGNSYEVAVSQNGILTITAELYNHQKVTREIEIEITDKSAPDLVSYDFQADAVIITVSDKDSGIAFDKICGYLPDKTKVLPISYNEEMSTVQFDYPESTLNIHIPDQAENTLQIILSPAD